MGRLSLEQLRASTLRRQFPTISGRSEEAVVSLFERLGPIQSQVPWSPFLTASSRLPGVPYATMTGLFETHRLVKSSSLRGTVHTTTASLFPAVAAVARATRTTPMKRQLGLPSATADDLIVAIENYCGHSWRTRDEVVAYAKQWLVDHESPPVDRIWNVGSESYLWGHSGLLRRPPTTAWETRTDTLRRTATDVLGRARSDAMVELPDLVRRHLAAYGPVRRDDLVFFFGASIRSINAALTALGEKVIRLTGPDGEDLLDLAEPPSGGEPDPGLRLLPEFDGLLLGFHGRSRTRFLDADHLPRVWAKANGLFSPVVLHDQQIKAVWRTVTAKRRTTIEVTMLPGWAPLPEELFADQVQAVERVLGQQPLDLMLRPAG